MSKITGLARAILLIVVLAISLGGAPVWAQTYHDPGGYPNGSTIQAVQPIGQGYTLATNATSTGPTITHVVSGSYGIVCVATAWGGATATLQYLAPDGTTWLTATSPTSTTASLTANGSVYAAVGANATIRMQVSGGTPTALNCNMT